MFKNYLVTAYRSFARNKIFSLINIFGLSVGISAALVIFLIVWYEFSYDRFESDGNRIYRVVMDLHINGDDMHSAGIPAPLGEAVSNGLTGLQLTVPTFQFQGDATATVSIPQAQHGNPAVYKKQKDIVFTDAGYFQFLSYRWLAGSPAASMREPFNVVLTESRAKQYFPGLTPDKIPGREMIYNDGHNEFRATVSGIVQDLGETTRFTEAEFISLATIAKTNLQSQFMMTVWNDWMTYSHLYLKLAGGHSPAVVEAQLNGLYKKRVGDQEMAKAITFRLQPLRDIHFDARYTEVGHATAQKSTLYGLLAIAVFLLLLGCINFINLSTAQASRRAREIGIRKTLGSSRGQLVGQVLGETFFITLLATLVSVVLTPLLLHVFRDFIPEGLHFDLLRRPAIIGFLLLLILVVGFLSGLYPAFILAGFRPWLALKDQAFAGRAGTRSRWIRKSLTVSQFVIAQFFIIATMAVGRQIHYTLHKEMGFKKEGIVMVPTPFDTAYHNVALLQQEIKALPEVDMVSNGFFTPITAGSAFMNTSFPEKPDLHVNVSVRWGDTNYLKLYGIKLVAGRAPLPSDTFREFVINETYARLLGFQRPEEAVNRKLGYNGHKIPIVGVMRDFHFASFHAPIGALVFSVARSQGLHIRLLPQQAGAHLWPQALAKIEKAYRRIYPGADFSYAFLDDTIAGLYKAESDMERLLVWATGLTILISCLGMLGLVIYTTNTRTREIGIRKVLGASVAHVVSLLSKDFVRLVLLAFLLAAPAAWWAVHRWLDNFAYRAPVSWWLFALSGLAMLLFALITLSFQTIRTALANPVNSLRTE